MARFLRNPVLIEFHEVFDEGEKRIPIEPLSVDWLVKVQAALEGVIYRESKPRSTCVHAFHIHVGSEERYFTVFISVRLHALEKRLSIVQNGRGRFDRKRAVCERLSDTFVSSREVDLRTWNNSWGPPAGNGVPRDGQHVVRLKLDCRYDR